MREQTLILELKVEQISKYIIQNHSCTNHFGTGPIANTVGDFWRMIWEYRLPTVVMLTRCFEGKVSIKQIFLVEKIVAIKFFPIGKEKM